MDFRSSSLLMSLVVCLLEITRSGSVEQHAISDGGSGQYTIEGKVSLPKGASPKKNWIADTKILVNYGQYMGFIKDDGSFSVYGVEPGSYVVEVASTDYVFEPVRVDVTSKGKIRTRKLEFLRPNAVSQMAYPLKLMARQPANYFRKREEWRVTDMLMNPMVLMMLVPFLLIVVMPKLINTDDPELKKEMQNMQMPKYEVPELSEVMTNWFGSGSSSKKSKPKAIAGIGVPKKRN